MSIHPILLVNRRSNVVLEVIGGDPDMNVTRDFERFPFLRCYIVPFFGTTGTSPGLRVGGNSGSG